MKLKSIKKHKDGSEIFVIFLNQKEEKLFRRSAKKLNKRYSKKFIRESVLKALQTLVIIERRLNSEKLDSARR